MSVTSLAVGLEGPASPLVVGFSVYPRKDSLSYSITEVALECSGSDSCSLRVSTEVQGQGRLSARVLPAQGCEGLVSSDSEAALGQGQKVWPAGLPDDSARVMTQEEMEAQLTYRASPALTPCNAEEKRVCEPHKWQLDSQTNTMDIVRGSRCSRTEKR